MATGADPSAGDAFLVIAPAGRDAEVIGELLASAQIDCLFDPDGERLLAALAAGEAAGAIVTDDALARIGTSRLREAIERQPPWSDFPFVLLARRGETRHGARSIEELVNVTILERPLHPASLVSAARSALRARTRQRLAAKHLAQREAARAELRELADTLEGKVEGRTRDLAAANDRLTAEIAERERAETRLVQAQKMEAVGQLTGGIAHDFNNLLTAVVGSLDLLLRRTDDEKLRRLAGIALQAAERGAHLTSQLLAFSRRQRLSPAPIQPNGIVSGMGDLLARTIGPHVRVETRLDPNLWKALADPTQLEVMILNLAINARDAMPGGGRLTISTRNVDTVPDQLAAELPEGQYVAIAVADTGTGMTPSVLARAFEPFFTTKEQGRGTGLGLAQLYGFAKQSGGTARIETREGEGTTVTIYLPRTQRQTATSEPPVPEAKPAERVRILVVDDDDDVRTIAAALIEEIGYEVVAVASAEAALRALEPDRFALVVTDVAMPGATGVDLARRIREIAPDMPILFASGFADVQTFGPELSDEMVLKKPYRIAELAARIGAALADRRRGGNVVELRR
ncbi:MAG TPA: response regulator [Allosphingosinicella sp.]|nr:response regulator [Allosphingosinicella sp.]